MGQAIPGAAAAAGELHQLNPHMAAFAAAAGAPQHAQAAEAPQEEPALVLPAPNANGVAAGVIAAHEAAAAEALLPPPVWQAANVLSIM